jgi:hypothetical protein
VTGNALTRKTSSLADRYKIIFLFHIVTCSLKARTVELEKHPSLESGSEITFLSRQRPRNTTKRRSLLRSRFLISKNRRLAARERLGKHVPAATYTYATEEQCFLRGSC